MKKKKFIWNVIIISIFLLIILNVVMFIRGTEYNEQLSIQKSNQSSNALFEGKTETGEKCPDSKGGLENADLRIKYFYSKFCLWCMREEPILQKLVKNYGNLIYIEWYNINDCSELAHKYEVSGVPTFIFSKNMNKTEYAHYGFVYEKDLMKLMCDVTGGC